MTAFKQQEPRVLGEQRYRPNSKQKSQIWETDVGQFCGIEKKEVMMVDLGGRRRSRWSVMGVGTGQVPRAQTGRSGQPPRGSSSDPGAPPPQICNSTPCLHPTGQRLQYRATPNPVSHHGDPSEMQLFLTTVQGFNPSCMYPIYHAQLPHIMLYTQYNVIYPI